MEIKDNKSIEKDELTGDKLLSGHEYDGIKELDNRLPRWWLWLFIISIVWAVVYLFMFDVIKVAPHQQEEFQSEIKQYGDPLMAAAFDTNQVALADPASLEAGKAVYDKFCVACHLAQGQGKIGPNLCDTFAIHGCDFKSILKTVAFGYPEKGMIAWKAQLSKDDIVKVSSFILTLKGTNP
ncbi:MAG: cbb3-type cytochrome c oxidase N-terminal domain-containing protein, partial [Bacteroidota bacterium]